MYDVLFIDRTHGEKLLGHALARDAACQLARAESQRRGVGRMFLAGSEPNQSSDVVLIVDSAHRTA